MNAAVFQQAVKDGDATRVKFLIEIGQQQAKVNQRNKQGYTSLQQSCKDGRYEVAEVLLSHGANIAATDKKGRTALHLASAGGYVNIVKLLIASCANVSAKDNEGKLAIDVAKSDEITDLLEKTTEEKQAKNPDTNKKVVAEDWSQNVTSLPAGSRNSLVSNSSSDSGVYTEEISSARNGDYKLARPNGYTSTRGSLNDTRVMGVLNESDENLHEISCERARTEHDARSSTTEDVYEQTRNRSGTLENDTRPLMKGNQYELSKQLHGKMSSQIDKSQYEFTTHFSAGNPRDQHSHESHLTVQTSMKIAHKANPQPKLRRSMSERLPARQRKLLNGRRDISEELSALNLSRARQNNIHYDLSHRCDFVSKNLESIPEPQSPNEDLGYGGEIPSDFDDYGRSWQRNYYASGSKTLPRNQRRREEFNPTRDESRREGNWEKYICGRPQFSQNRSNFRDLNRINTYGDTEFNHRAQPRNTRGLRTQTIEICQTSNLEDGYLTTGDRNHTYSNNEGMQKYSHQEIPRSCVTADNNRFDSRDFDEDLANNNVTLMRRDSACSDTAVASYRRRMQSQNYENYIEYNSNHDYYHREQKYCRSLPSYEETLQRQRVGSDSRRPASRQVSHV